MTYTVRHADIRPEINGAWDSTSWAQANTLEVACFRPEGSSHQPLTSAKILYNRTGIFGIFRVEDRYIKSIRTDYGDAVYKDSCVEFFVQPKSQKGYFNFEFNCGGVLLCSYISDPERVGGVFREFIKLPWEDGQQVSVYHSMPQIVDPEIIGPDVWVLEFFLPFVLLERYVGTIGNIKGQKWRANLYKCADETSHPHWASWAPVNELNFHMPQCFGTILFE